MRVAAEDHERTLAEVVAEVGDARAGLFGPGSIVWRIAREQALFLGGGRAALLQLAHPFVAHAVHQHSQVGSDPLGRFQRTFDNLFAMVFGDLDSVLRSARRVYAVHARIRGAIDEDVGEFRRGVEYAANDAGALFWVQATLIDTAVLVYERVVRPLTINEKNLYYLGQRRINKLFGIPDSAIPADWPAFQGYMGAMLDSRTITVGGPARAIGESLFAARRSRGLFAWARVLTAGLLPERLREEYRFAFGAAERALFASSLMTVKRALPLLPKELRYQPAYVAAMRRLRGLSPETRISSWVRRRLPQLLAG